MPKNLRLQTASRLPSIRGLYSSAGKSRFANLQRQSNQAGSFVDRLFSAMDERNDSSSSPAASEPQFAAPSRDWDRIHTQQQRIFNAADAFNDRMRQRQYDQQQRHDEIQAGRIARANNVQNPNSVQVADWAQPQNQIFRTPLNRIANPQLPQFARQAAGRVAASEPNAAYSVEALSKQLGGIPGLNYNAKTNQLSFTQRLGAGQNARSETYNINRDERSGLITLGHQNSPSRGFAVTGRVNIDTNERTGAVDVLRQRLGEASRNPADSIVKILQTQERATSLHLGHLTSPMKAKWATSETLTRTPDPKTGEQPKTYASDVHKWMQQPGNEDVGFRGEGNHVWSVSRVASANWASYTDAAGKTRWLGGKSFKREQNQGIHETFEHQEIAPGVNTPLTQWGARFAGQTEVNQGVMMRSSYALHANALIPEGQAFINRDSGYIGTTSTQRVKLNEQQMALMREGKHDEALGYQAGDIFNYRRRGTPTTILDTDRMRDGIYSDIPGSPKSDAGSYAFARIGGVEFNEEGGYADVSLTKNIPTWEGVAKFGNKNSLAPLAGNSPLFQIGSEQVEMLANAPDAKDLATLGMHSMLSTYGTEELQSRFVQHAMNTRGMSESDATALFGGGVIGGENALVFDEMARQHIKDSWTTATIPNQRVSLDQMKQYATQDASGQWIPNQTTGNSGQQYTVYSNIRPQSDGTFSVDYTDEFLTLSKAERFKPEYDRGRHLVNEEMLNNMVVSNPGLYQSVREMESAGFAPNSARDLTQAVYANARPETLAKMEDQGRIVDFNQLGYADAINGLPTAADPNEHVTNVMKALAAGEHGDKAVRIGGIVLPSAKTALSNLTADPEGELVQTFGKQWHDAMAAAANAESVAGMGGNPGAAMQSRDVAAYKALNSATDLVETESIQKRAKGIELDMIGGHAMARSGLAANEVVMSKSAFFEQMGIHNLPEEHRAAAKDMALDALRNQQVGLSHNMFPQSVPSKAYPVAQISLLEDVRKREGFGDMADPGQNYWISPELAMMMAKDNDGDQNYGFTTGKIGMVNGAPGLVGGHAPINSAEYVQHHARKSVLEYGNLAEGAGANLPDMLAHMDAARAEGKTSRDAAQYAQDVQAQIAGKAAMGPTYNTGIRGHIPFEREMAGKYVAAAGDDAEREKRQGQARMADEALSYLSEKSYQQATKLSENDDPATRQLIESMKGLRYDTARGNGFKSGIAKQGGSFEEVPEGSTIPGLAKWITGTVAKYNMQNSEYAATPEEYAANVAPDLARSLVPLKHVGNEEMEAKVRDRLIRAKTTGEDFDVAGYAADIGMKSPEHAVLGSLNSTDPGDTIPLLNNVLGASIVNMEGAANRSENPNLAALKHRGNFSERVQGYADTVSGIRKFDKVIKPTSSAEAYGAAANLPDVAYQHSKTAVSEMLGGGKFSDLRESIGELDPEGAFGTANMDMPLPTSGVASSQPPNLPPFMPDEHGAPSDEPPPYFPTEADYAGSMPYYGDSEPEPARHPGAVRVAASIPHNSYAPSPAAAGAGGQQPPINPAVAGAAPEMPQMPQGNSGGNVTTNNTYLQQRLGNTTFADADKLVAFNEHFGEFVDLLDKAKGGVEKLNPVEQKRLEILSKAYDESVSIQQKYNQRQRSMETNGENTSPADREIRNVLDDGLGWRLGMSNVRRDARDYQQKQALSEFEAKLNPDEGEPQSTFSILMAGGKKDKSVRDQAFKEGTFDNFLSDALPEGVNRGAAAAAGAVGRGVGNMLNPGTLWKLRTVNSMFVQPSMRAAQDYEEFKAQQALTMASAGNVSRSELMGSEYGRIVQRQNRQEAAHRAFGEQAYSIYAPMMDAFANRQTAQSVLGAGFAMAGPAVGLGIVGAQVGKAVLGEDMGKQAGLVLGAASVPLQLGAYALGNRQNYEAMGRTGQWHDLITNPAGVLGKSGVVMDTLASVIGGDAAGGGRNYRKAGSSELLNIAGGYLASGEYTLENVKGVAGDVGGPLGMGSRRTTVGEQFTNAEIRGAGFQSWYKNMTEQQGYSDETTNAVYGTWAKYNRDLLAQGAVAPAGDMAGALGEFTDTGVNVDDYMASVYAAQGISPADATGRGKLFRAQMKGLVDKREGGVNLLQETDEQTWGNNMVAGANVARRIAGMENLTADDVLKYKSSPEQSQAYTNLKTYEAEGAVYNPLSEKYSGMVGYRQEAIDRGDLATDAKLAGAVDLTGIGVSGYYRSPGTDMATNIGNMGKLSAATALDPIYSLLGPEFAGGMANLASQGSAGAQSGIFKDNDSLHGFLESGARLQALGITGDQMMQSRLGVSGKMATTGNMQATADSIISDITSGNFDPNQTQLEMLTSGIRGNASAAARLSGRAKAGESYSLTTAEMQAMADNDAVGTAWQTATGAHDTARMAQDGFADRAFGAFSKIENLAFSDPTTAMRLSSQMSHGQALYQQYSLYGGGEGAKNAAAQMGMLDQPDFQRVNALAQGDRLALSQNYGSMAQVQGMGLGNIRLRTMNADTGMGIFYQNVDAAGVGQLRANDQYGLLNDVSDELLAGGQRGIQARQRNTQRGFEQFQYDRQMDQMALGNALQIGSGHVGADSFMQGGGLDDAAKLFEKLGKSFMKGIQGSTANGMNFTQLEDYSRKLSREQQDYGLAQEEKQMGAGGLKQRQMDLQISQFYEKFGLNERQFAWNTANQRSDMTRMRGREVEQQGWAQENLSFSRSQNELGFAWGMEDSDRNIRYARGRDRRDLMRQRERDVIQHGMQMAQSEVEQGRLNTQQQWSEQDYKIQQERFEQSIKFTQEEMDMQKRHFEESMALQRESFGMEQEAFQKKKQWTMEQRDIEDQRILLERQNSELQMSLQKEMAERSREVQLTMNQYNDALQRMSDEQTEVNAQIDLMAKNGKLAEAAMQGMNGAAGAAAANTMAAAGGTAAFAGATGLTGAIASAAAGGVQQLNASLTALINSFSRQPASSTSVSHNTTQSPAHSGASTATGNHVGPGTTQRGYAEGGYVEKPMRGFAEGGFTGFGGKNELAGVVHGGEYVVPQDGALVIRNDDMAADIKKMVRLLEKMVSYGPMRVNARISTNQPSVRVGDFYNPTDDIYGNL